MLKEKKMEDKCMLRVVDDDIESPYTIVSDYLISFYKVGSIFVSLS